MMKFGLIMTFLAWTAFPGDGRVQGTSEHLRIASAVGPGAAVEARVSDRVTVQVAANEARPRVSLRGDGTGRRIRVVPLSFTLLDRLETRGRVEPYVGAGIEYPLVRRALDPVAGVARIEQPDHVALALQAGARMPLSRRWWLGADAKVLPFSSTFETHTAEDPKHALQTNFHPVVVTTGAGVRF
jgi:outer membrane protein W